MKAATPFVPVTTSLLRGHRLLLWITLLVMLVAALLAIAVSGQAEPDQRSVWETGAVPIRAMMLVVGIKLTPTVLPTYLYYGITRRTVTRAASAAIGAFAGATAILITAGFLLERAIFNALDHPYQLDREHLFTEVGQVPLVFVEYLLTGAAYLVSGWLIGGSFYRFGWQVAAPALPLSLLPVAGIESLVDDSIPTHPSLPVPVLVVLGLGVLTLGLAAVHALHRSIPLRAGG